MVTQKQTKRQKYKTSTAHLLDKGLPEYIKIPSNSI